MALDQDPAPTTESDTAPPPPTGRAACVHNPRCHVHCGKTAGWIKLPLGTEVGLGQRYCVRWRPSSLTEGAQQTPLFGLCLLWRNCCRCQQLLSSCYVLKEDKGLESHLHLTSAYEYWYTAIELVHRNMHT